MQRFDRILGVLLFLRSRKSVSASELAHHFEVSTRTLYRDIETLSSLGVPIYAERGRNGGFRLLEGYFLPPLMFSRDEAISLLLGLAVMRSLRSYPFPNAFALAEQKILTALPDTLRTTLERTEKIIGFEQLPHDVFHPEPQPRAEVFSAEQMSAQESQVVTIFVRALLDGQAVFMHYQSPYRPQSEAVVLKPQGLFWDRNRWYLVGQQLEGKIRLWRADRVSQIRQQLPDSSVPSTFDVGELLGHRWLRSAMEEWRKEGSAVKIRLTNSQAQRLRQDWYYRHASFEPLADNFTLMTFGESNASFVLELLRWLGPGAELLEPRAWREKIRLELQTMLEQYAVD